MLLRIVKKKLEKTFQSELESKRDSVLNMNVHILLDGSQDRKKIVVLFLIDFQSLTTNKKKKSAFGVLSFGFNYYSGDFVGIFFLWCIYCKNPYIIPKYINGCFFVNRYFRTSWKWWPSEGWEEFFWKRWVYSLSLCRFSISEKGNAKNI